MNEDKVEWIVTALALSLVVLISASFMTAGCDAGTRIGAKCIAKHRSLGTCKAIKKCGYVVPETCLKIVE